MSFEADSKCVDAICEAVNFGERRDVVKPDILLLHYTGMNDGDAARKWLCCEESGVSCHYLIYEDGETLQLVPEQKRAHHAGAGAWEGHDDVNSRSIGIEIVNAGHPENWSGDDSQLPEFPSDQMEAVARLSRDVIDRYAIVAHRVLAHSDIAPGRKQDPGERFDWHWLSQRGVGHWVEPKALSSGQFFQHGESGQPIEALQSMLSLYGYELEISGYFCDRTFLVVEAFQRHFRQEKVDGVADISTIDTLHRLLVARNA